MAFLEQRLDSKITAGATGGPTVPGRTKTYINGKLFQNFTATIAQHKFDVSHGLRSRADFQAVLDLWYIVMFTPYDGFRFKDWRDYQATVLNSKLTLITGSTWQLQRRHLFGGIEFLRDITKPVSGTVVVYSAGGAVLPATIDSTTGIATVTGTPATWVGEFDVPVTFTDDEWIGSLEVTTDALHVESGPIKLEELLISEPI